MHVDLWWVGFVMVAVVMAPLAIALVYGCIRDEFVRSVTIAAVVLVAATALFTGGLVLMELNPVPWLR